MQAPPPPGSYPPPPGGEVPPQGPGNYPRGPYGGAPQSFTADKVMGIILIILAGLGACLSLAVVGIGGAVGAMGAAGASGAAGNNPAAGNAAGAVAAGGGLLMVFGIIYLITCVVNIVGGAFMLSSKRKGFMMVLGVGLVSLVLSLIMGAMSGNFNIVGLLTGLIFPGYAAARAFGNFGPTPV